MSQEKTCRNCEYFVPKGLRDDDYCDLFEAETESDTEDCREFSHKDARAVTMNRFGDGEA